MKYLFMKHGWTAETMLAAVEEKMGYKLTRRGRAGGGGCVSRPVGDPSRRSRRAELRGRDGAERADESAEQLHAVAGLAEKYGDGHLRATIGQNIVLVNVPNAKTRRWWRRLQRSGCRWSRRCSIAARWRARGRSSASWRSRRRRGFAKWLVGEMEERMPEFDQQLRLHVTGCTNNCGQSWIADIGLEGKKIKKEARWWTRITFAWAGRWASTRAIARQIGYRAAAEDAGGD